MALSLGGFSGRSGGNALVVAASNAPGLLKAGADFVCGGTDDDVQIRRALALLDSTYGGTVLLTPGLFTVGAPIYLTQGQKVHGAGMQATLIQAALDHPFDMFRWELTPTFGPTTASGGSSTTITFAGDVTGSIAVDATIRIARGTGYGQKRTVTGRSYAAGTTTVTISTGSTDWSISPDNTSVAVIDAGSELFGGLAYFTATGRRKTASFTGGNEGVYGLSVGAMSDATLVDSVGSAFPSWVTDCSVYIYGGTGIGQLRRIVGRATTTDTNDTLLLDGPWYTDLDDTSAYAVVGNGFAQYGHNCLDFQYHNVWMTQFTGFGFMTEFTWGHEAIDMISEFNDLGGWYISQSPLGIAVTSGTFGSSSTGHVANSGPKLTNSKILANGSPDAYGGSGIMVYGRVIDGKVTNSELGSDCGIWYGIDLCGGYGSGPSYWSILGCNFGSWDNQDAAATILSAGIRLGTNAVYNTIVGNTCRASNTAGPRAFVMVPTSGGQRNIIANNIVGLGTDGFLVHNGSTGGAGVLAQGKDGTGWNLYRDNLSTTSRQQDHVLGVLAGVADGSGDIALHYPGELMALPTAIEYVGFAEPYDDVTRALTTPYVKSVAYDQLAVATAAGTKAATTLGEALESGDVGVQASYLVGDTTKLTASGYAILDVDGANEEDVIIVSIEDGTHATFTPTKTHANGVAFGERYQFRVRVDAESRATGR